MPEPRKTVPEAYWASARHHYFRDHEKWAWGVADVGKAEPIATGLDKSVAAAMACLLNGDVDLARIYLEGLPGRMQVDA